MTQSRSTNHSPAAATISGGLVEVVNRSNLNEARGRRETPPSRWRDGRLRMATLALAALPLVQSGPSVAAATPEYRSTLYESPLGSQLAPGRYLPLAGYQAPGASAPESSPRRTESSQPQGIIDLLSPLSVPASGAERAEQGGADGPARGWPRPL